MKSNFNKIIYSFLSALIIFTNFQPIITIHAVGRERTREELTIYERVLYGFYDDLEAATESYLYDLKILINECELSPEELVENGHFGTIEEAEFFGNLTFDELLFVNSEIEAGRYPEEFLLIYETLYGSDLNEIRINNYKDSYYYSEWDYTNEYEVGVGGRKIVIPPLIAAVRKTAAGVRQVLRTAPSGATAWINITNGRAAGTTVRLANGRSVRFDNNGFPVFNRRFQMTIANSELRASRAVHKNRAINSLRDAVQRGTSTGWTNAERAMILNRQTPPDWRWHHHQNRGRMELVHRLDHAASHMGGFAIWGP